MRRGQKVARSAHGAVGKLREVDPPESHGKRLKAVSTTSPERARKISPHSVAAHALATFGSREKAQHWMNRPNPLFQGKTPAQVIEFDLVGVEAELVRIDHGVYM